LLLRQYAVFKTEHTIVPLKVKAHRNNESTYLLTPEILKNQSPVAKVMEDAALFPATSGS
jgi:hypothetical protein